jgi:cell fate (sporulation/competence/biofilm development) regulator YmcA (YheA/YmcA/DUF963 family)
MIDNENYSTGSSIGATSTTFAHEILTGTTNRLLVVSTFHQTNENISNVTFNGVNMTFIARNSHESGNRRIEMWYLVNPPVGTYNVVITRATGSEQLAGYAESYSGVAQTNTLNASTTNIVTSANQSITTTLTTTVDNCWACLVARNDTENYASYTNFTLRSAAGNPIFGDTNAAQTPAGSKSMTVSVTNTALHISVMAAFAPYTSTAYTVTCSETLSLSDTVSKSTHFNKTLTETISMTEAVSKSQGISKTLTETITLSDVVSNAVQKGLVLLETLHLTDALEKTTHFAKTLTETISLTDTLSSAKQFFITLSETLHLTDAISKSTHFAKTLSETIHLTDAIKLGGWFWNYLFKRTSSYDYKTKSTNTCAGGTKTTSSWSYKDKDSI